MEQKRAEARLKGEARLSQTALAATETESCSQPKLASSNKRSKEPDLQLSRSTPLTSVVRLLSSSFDSSYADNYALQSALEVVPADSTSPTAPSSRSFPSRTTTLGTQAASSSFQQALGSGPVASGSRSVTPGVAGRSKPVASTSATGLGIIQPARDSRGKEVRTSEFVDYDLSTLKYASLPCQCL